MDYKRSYMTVDFWLEKAKIILKTLGLVLIFFVSQVACSIIFDVFITFKAMSLVSDTLTLEAARLMLFDEYTNYMIFVSDLVAILSVFAVSLLVANTRRNRGMKVLSFNDRFGFRKTSVINIVVALVTGYALNGAVNIIMSFLPASWLDSYAESSGSLSAGSLLSLILGTVLLAPISEEIFYRAISLEGFSAAMPVTAAIITSSLLFGLGHGQILWIAYATLLGILFAYIYRATGSVWVSMCAHIGFNGANIIYFIYEKYYDISTVVDYILEGGDKTLLAPEALRAYTSYMMFSQITFFTSIPIAVIGTLYLLSRKRKNAYMPGDAIKEYLRYEDPSAVSADANGGENTDG